MSTATLTRAQRDLLSKLAFRCPDPCYLALTPRGYALVVTTMLKSRSLERMDRSYLPDTVTSLQGAGLIELFEFAYIPEYGYRKPGDSSSGYPVAITSAGRKALGVKGRGRGGVNE